MLVPTIKLLEFSDKNWETYERLLIFWSIFWLFFLLSKVSKMKFYRKSLIYKNTTLYDIDFPRKIGFLRFFLRKFLLTVLLIFHRKYTPNFQKIDFSIYPNILYIYDQNFMLVPTIKLLEFSDKNWETYERLLIFWSIFWLFFLLSKVSKMKFYRKSLIYKNTTLYDIDFPRKIGFLRFFLRKFLLTVLLIFHRKYTPNFQKIDFSIYPNILYIYDQNFMLVPTIKLLEFSDKNWETYERLLIFWSIFWLFFLLSKVSKMKFYRKSLIYKNTTLYDIDFPRKIGFLRFFLRKFLLTVLLIFHRKYTPNFQKIDFSIYPNILYIYDQNFMLVPTIKLLEFSDKNWETYERLLIFWSIFWLFFLLSKVSKMKFYRKSLIYKNTTLYDIDFPRKIGFLRFFLRKFLLTVLLIFHRKYTPNFQKIDFSIYPNILYIYDQNFMLVPTIKLLEFSDKNWETYERLLIFWSIFWLFFLLSKVSKMKFYRKSLIYKNTTLYDIDFPRKIGFLRFFLRKFLLTVLLIFHRKYTPNFQKIDFSIYPNILYIYDQNFMLVPTIKLLEFSDKNWETYERLLIFWSIFWLFFLLSKVSKMKFYRKSLIYKNTTLYDIDFPRKIGFLRFFLRKFLLTVLLIFHRKYTPNFQKIDFSIYPNILYIYDQNFMLVPTIKLLEFSDKNWETYERLLIFWSIFWLFFLLSKVSKMKFYRKSLIYKNTTLYDIDFPRKIGFLRFFLRKFLLTVLLIFHRKYTPNFQKIDFSIYPNILYIYDQNFMLVPTIKLLEFSDKNWETYERLLIFWSIFWLFFLLSKVSKMKFYRKSLIYKNTTLYDIDFPRKIGFLRFFLRKFLLTVLLIFHRKYTPNFQKIDFSIYPNILYIYDQNFMLVPTIKLLEFSDKNWETYERLLIFWSIFWLFFLLSKVSKMKFYRKSLIYKNTTLYDIDFPRKIGFLRFFLRKFLLTVLLIFHRKYTPNFQKIDFSIYPNILYIYDQNFMLVPTIKLLEFSDKNWETYERLLIFWSIFWLFFLLSKVSKMKFYRKSLIYKNTTLYDIDFPRKIGFLRFFLRKFLLTVLLIFHRKYTPNFQKIDFSIYPNILYIYDQNFMLVPTIKLLEFSDKNWETYERLLIFWSIFWLFFLLSKVSKMKFYRKSLIYKNTTLYDIDFPRKIGFLRFFLRKFLLTVLLIFHRKYTPNFQKIDFSIYPNILYIYDQNFMLVPTIKLLEFSDKNWETYERLLIFWSIFWLFFLLSKVSKMKFYRKSLIYKNTTLYDIDFPRKIGFLRFFLRKFLLTVLLIFHRKYTPNFQKIDFSIYPNILYIYDQNFMLVPTIKLLEFSDKNWETYERLLIFWSIFWLFFLLSKVSKMKFYRKSLIYKNTTLYDIDFPRKIGFLRFFLRKFLLTVLLIFHRKYTPNFQKIDFSIYPNILYIYDQNFMLVPTIKLLEFSDKNWETYERLLIFWSIFWLFFLLSKVSKMKFYRKSLIYKNTTLYDIDFPRKIGFLRFFLRKFLLTVLLIFHRKYTPNFQKIDFSIYPNILYIYDQNFMLVPTIKLLEFSDKNWETYERLLIFWSIFWLFFLLSKVSKMKFYRKSLIYKNTTLYDIDFPRKIGFLRFFLRKFLLTVLLIFHRKYTPNFQKIDFSIYPNILYIYDQNFMLVPTIKLLEFSDKNWETYERLLIFWSIFWLFFLLSKVSKMKFYRKSLIYKNTTLYDIDFPRKIGFLRFFLRKFLLTVLLIFHRKYTPNFQKIDFSIYPNILYIYNQNFMLVPTIKLLEFSDKNWETYERLLIFWSIFWLFFLLSKVSKMKFYRKSLIYKNTLLYDIDFPRKIGFLRFFLRKFLLTVLLIFHRKYTPNFQKIDFSIYPNILYIYDQNFMLVPTIKLLEFSDKNWETYERLLIFWSIFWLFFLLSKVSKMKFYRKSLIYKNATLYDIDFPRKIGFLRFFLRKFLLTVLLIFHRKYTPNFQKIDFSIYPYILYIYDQNFMLVPTIKLLEFSDKNWETYERLLIFWSIFWLFFLLSKVSKMKFYRKSLIYKNTTLYDIDFPRKIGFLRFFLRKFLLTVLPHFFIENTPQIFKKSTFTYTPIYYIFMIRILCSFQQSNY